MKKIFLLIIILLIFIFLNLNTGYQFKVELNIDNIPACEIDENIAKNIEAKLLNIKNIKKVIFISSEHGCNIYIKLYPICFNRNKIFQKIVNTTNSFMQEHNEIKSINYIDNYDTNYQYLIVITSKNNYFELKKFADEIRDKLLNLKISNDIKIYGLQQKAAYIYFTSNDLVKYNLEIEDIKNIIKNQNEKKNYITNYKNENFYPISIENKIKSIDDIKKITLNFKDKNFITNFGDIFKIEETIKIPKENNVIYKNKEAIVVAVSKKFGCPIFLLKYFLNKNNNCEIEILNIKNYKTIDLFFNSNYQAQNYKPQNKNDIYFFNKSPYKKDNFDESFKNRITVFTKNPNNYKEIIENNHQFTTKNLQINLKLNNYKINKYNISNKEIFNTISSQNEGLICDYYFENSDKIEIILKNNQQDNFIFSKKYKTLIDLNEIITGSLNEKHNIILRKNGKIFNKI